MHPYYQAILDAYAASGRPYFHQVTPQEAREMMRSSLATAPPPKVLPPLADVYDAVVDGPHGPIGVRHYIPNGISKGSVVFFHAGGWVIGDIALSDMLCRRLASAAGCEFISVDYRLAPEHSFPAPLDDAYAVLCWAAEHRPGPLLVAGESAGGNLAAACAIKARDEQGPQLVGQFLAYPVTDHDFDTASYQELGAHNWLLSTADMRWFFDQYCPADVDRANPLISPLRVQDASGLPPTLLFVGDYDPLRDEGLAYAAKLAGAGVSVAQRHDAQMLHGYLSASGAIDVAAEAVAQAAEWISAQLQVA